MGNPPLNLQTTKRKLRHGRMMASDLQGVLGPGHRPVRLTDPQVLSEQEPWRVSYGRPKWWTSPWFPVSLEKVASKSARKVARAYPGVSILPLLAQRVFVFFPFRRRSLGPPTWARALCRGSAPCTAATNSASCSAWLTSLPFCWNGFPFKSSKRSRGVLRRGINRSDVFRLAVVQFRSVCVGVADKLGVHGMHKEAGAVAFDRPSSPTGSPHQWHQQATGQPQSSKGEMLQLWLPSGADELLACLSQKLGLLPPKPSLRVSLEGDFESGNMNRTSRLCLEGLREVPHPHPARTHVHLRQLCRRHRWQGEGCRRGQTPHCPRRFLGIVCLAVGRESLWIPFRGLFPRRLSIPYCFSLVGSSPVLMRQGKAGVKTSRDGVKWNSHGPHCSAFVA